MAAPLTTALPETQKAEATLALLARTRFGITYTIRWQLPNLAAVRTPADTAQLIAWRDEAVTKARAKGGDTAAAAAYYRVSPQDQGFHGIGGAFDIYIAPGNVGTSKLVTDARKAGELKRQQSGGSAVQVKGAGDAAAVRQAYELVGKCAPASGLRWGGLFSAPADPFHFELAQDRSAVAAKWAAHLKAARQAGTTRPVVVWVLGGAALLAIAVRAVR